jgi:type I restriction enzyme S subunit
LRSNYKRIGSCIRQINVKNTEGKYDLLLGININKYFMPSVANIVGTDLTRYKVVKKNQFACNRMHVGRDYRIPMALSDSESPFIVSPAYTVFEIIDESNLLPEYLMMWFSRAEFDRETWFHTDADVRGGLPWDLFCNIELPIPSIKKQQEIVNEYNTITNRIALNEQLNQKLEETAQALYKHWFVDFEFPNEEGEPYKSSGGKMVYNEELDKDIPEGWEVKGLSSIAVYLNGTAMQKHPRNNELEYTPVLKIRELNLGFSDDKSDKASFDIPEKYKIYNEDIIFSWSGTLTIDIWTGGYAGLNQHLFKVSSEEFPKWYYYLCTKYYVGEFIRIAEGNKTSMGHIKREHLDNSYICYSKDGLVKFNYSFETTVKKIILKKLMNNKLSDVRDLMLSKMTKVEVEEEIV